MVMWWWLWWLRGGGVAVAAWVCDWVFDVSDCIPSKSDERCLCLLSHPAVYIERH